jgi:methylenetetrahydrofolate reductase (NADPH)
LNTFRDAILTHPFTLTAELGLSSASDAAAVMQQAGLLASHVDAIQVSDNPNGRLQLSAVAAAAILLQNGIDCVPLITCRDRNRLALQSDLLGLGALGVTSVLLMHGDKLPKDHPGHARQVFEIGGKELLATARSFASDDEIPAIPDLFIGATATVFRPKRDWEPKTMLAKTEAGADFIQTQLCFDMEALRRYLDRLVSAKITWRAPIVVSLATLPSAESAEWLSEHLRGSLMPPELIKRLQQAADPEQEGVKICAELLEELSTLPGISGANLMTPGDPSTITAAIEASGTRLIT